MQRIGNYTEIEKFTLIGCFSEYCSLLKVLEHEHEAYHQNNLNGQGEKAITGFIDRDHVSRNDCVYWHTGLLDKEFDATP